MARCLYMVGLRPGDIFQNSSGYGMFTGGDVYKRQVQLYRKIKALTNYSPNELVRIARLKKAASLLASSEKTRCV